MLLLFVENPLIQIRSISIFPYPWNLHFSTTQPTQTGGIEKWVFTKPKKIKLKDSELLPFWRGGEILPIRLFVGATLLNCEEQISSDMALFVYRPFFGSK